MLCNCTCTRGQTGECFVRVRVVKRAPGRQASGADDLANEARGVHDLANNALESTTSRIISHPFSATPLEA
jgi:hypothetical protein